MTRGGPFAPHNFQDLRKTLRRIIEKRGVDEVKEEDRME